MSPGKKNDQELIEELQDSVKQKDAEIQRYRLELAKTNQALEKLIVDLSQELKWVSVIQKALSPTQMPTIPGFEFSTKFVPGSQAGGDYFDIFEHDDRLKFGILLSSSSGYSMSALFLSVLLKLSNRIEAKKGIQPAQALQMLAQEMRPNMQPKDEAQIFYGVFDRRSFELTYSTYGALAAFLQVQDTDKLVRLEPAGQKLNVNSKDQPLQQSVTMGPRDRLILCSEGVTSAVSSQGSAFGLENLQKTILRAPKTGVHELRNEILFSLEQFTGLSDPARDLTVVVVEVSDRVIKLAK